MPLDLGIFDNMKLSWCTGESSEHRHSKKCVSNYLDTPKVKWQNNTPKQEIHYIS